MMKNNKVCQCLAAGRCFSPGTPVSSTNKTDRHDITEILLKVVLNNITHPPKTINLYLFEKASLMIRNYGTIIHHSNMII
jgi:hypothetical protein